MYADYDEDDGKGSKVKTQYEIPSDQASSKNYVKFAHPTWNNDSGQFEYVKYNDQTGQVEFTSSKVAPESENSIWGKNSKGVYGEELIPARDDSNLDTYELVDMGGVPGVRRGDKATSGRMVRKPEDVYVTKLDDLDPQLKAQLEEKYKDQLQTMFPDQYKEDPDKTAKEYVKSAIDSFNKFWDRHPGMEFTAKTLSDTFIALGTSRKFMRDLDAGVNCFRGFMNGILNGRIMNACAYTIYGAFATLDCLSDSVTSFEGSVRENWKIYSPKVQNTLRAKEMEKELKLMQAVELDLYKSVGDSLYSMVTNTEQLGASTDASTPGADSSEDDQYRFVEEGDEEAFYQQAFNRFSPEGIRTHVMNLGEMRAMCAVQLEDLKNGKLSPEVMESIPGKSQREKQKYMEAKLVGFDQLIDGTLAVARNSGYITKENAANISTACEALKNAQSNWTRSLEGKRLQSKFNTLSSLEKTIYGDNVGEYDRFFSRRMVKGFNIPNISNPTVSARLSPYVDCWNLFRNQATQ